MKIDARKTNESRGNCLTGFGHLAGAYTDGLGPEYLAGAHLYFVCNAEGSCKIGKTTDLVSRMRTLQNASASRLRLEMYLPGMGWQEKVWHAAFCNWRQSGEWFEWCDPLRAAVEAARVGEEWIATLPELGSLGSRSWSDVIADREEIAMDRFLDAFWKAHGSDVLRGRGQGIAALSAGA